MKYPVVYYYKEDASHGEDLKYSIRSVVKNFPYSKIILLGDKPSWFHESKEFIHIPSDFRKETAWTLGWVPFQHMLTLIKHADFEDFILFNDDFFVTKKITKFQDMYRLESDYEMRCKANRLYHRRTVRALTYTESKKYFNLHAPMRMKISRMKEFMNWWLKNPEKDLDFRTLYGNRYINDYPDLVGVVDFKSSYIRKDLMDPELREYFSTSSQDFLTPPSEIGKHIKEMFPKPTKCEKPPIEKI